MPDSAISYQPISFLNHCRDRHGYLVLCHGVVAALIVRLDDTYPGNLSGQWFMEKGFGVCEGRSEPFESFDAAVAWISERGCSIENRDAHARAQAAQRWTEEASTTPH